MRKRIGSFGLFFLAFFLHPSWSKRPPRLVTSAAAINNSNHTAAAANVTVLTHINGRHSGYLVNSSAFFSIQRPKSHLVVVSQQAQEHGCLIATNGGPFQSNGDCVGGVVVDKRVVSSDFRDTNVGFGFTGSKKWILGGIRNASEAQSLQVEHFVTGFDWLVYEGTVVQQGEKCHRHVHPHNYRAPRTAIGVDKRGHLLLLLVDGCEACLRHCGITLEELATLFESLGAHHAINLDGGSSTTFVQDFRVVNVPTCHDVPWKCERPVATIVCLKDDPHHDGGESDSQEEEEAQ